MLKKAINELYAKFPYQAKIKYSAKFKPYRANVRLTEDRIQFRLSKTWKTISNEIKAGLIQELLLKLLKNKLEPVKTSTQSIELYNIFMKKLHLGIPKTESHPILEESFNRVNEKYFYGLVEPSNLVWADSINKLGSYEYGTDTISISRVLVQDQDALDYVMYHEMLHKKHKFYNKNGRSYHHTAEFRKKEKEFDNSHLMEKRLAALIKRGRFGIKRKKRSFFSLF